MALKFSMILEAVDRATLPLKRIESTVNRLEARMTKLDGAGTKGGHGLKKVEDGAKKAAGAADKMERSLGRANHKLRDTESLAFRAGRGLGRMVGTMAKWSAGLLLVGAGLALREGIKLASGAEQAEAELTAISGSAAKARIELIALRGMRLGAPIEELTSAYVLLRRAGIDPSQKSLSALVDEARQSKKPLDELVKAIADAKNGGFGGLESLNVKASSRKGMTTFTWLDKEGKRATRTVRDSASQIEKALLGIFGSRSAGAADRFGRTIEGMRLRLTNLGKGFLLNIAERGSFATLEKRVQRIIDRIDGWAADGSLDRWAQNISDQLVVMTNKAFDFIENTDWTKVASGLQTIFAVIGQIISGLTTMIEKLGEFKRWQAEHAANVYEGQENSWFVTPANKRAAANERRRMEAALGGPVTETGRREARQRGARFRTPISPLGLHPSAPPRALPARKIGANQGTNVGGAIRVILEAKGGTAARVASVSSDNARVPVIVQQGRTMAGAA